MVETITDLLMYSFNYKGVKINRELQKYHHPTLNLFNFWRGFSGS